MTTDAQAAAAFYDTETGAIAAAILQTRLLALWPNMSGQIVLGLGFAAPFLQPWHIVARRCVVAIPGTPIALRGSAGLTCGVDEQRLPFADLSFDRILLVHGIETADSARAMLREAWRVLKDDGQLLLVAPNRAGMWAHIDSTPFGQGQPYSPRQIGDLLAASLFRVERRDTALYVPPTSLRAVLRSAALMERVGRGILPRLAGVTLTEAVKDIYAALPVHAVVRRRVVRLPEAA